MGGGATDSNSDDFSISGPNKLTSINWDNSYHRTTVVSCLVNGVYTMQRDKAKKRASPLAKPWWEFFGFSLIGEPLINEADDSIYGAVFEYNKYDNYQKNTPHLGRRPPRCVIAFRGTILSPETMVADIQQDLRCVSNTLNHGRRFKHAIQTIKTVLAKHDSETTSVWLAGHSLGAGIALLAGKAMAKDGFPLETYAFNPPHSCPLEFISYSNVLKGGFRLANGLCKATLGTLASLFDVQSQEDDPRIAAWAPYLYVNTADQFCSEFISDFKRKKIMAKIGLSKIESVIARIHLRSLFFGGGGGGGTSSLPPAEPIQLLSSADMTVNMIHERDHLTKGHELKQWWEPDPALRENWKFHSFRHWPLSSTIGFD